jgi:hypothetical protein
MFPSLLVESLNYQPIIYAMTVIEPLENEPRTAGTEESDPAENPSNTTNDDVDNTESEFAPWDE